MTTPKLTKTLMKKQFATTSDKQICLNDFQGKNLVLYFYPKDDTSGCTQEGLDFSENYKKFKRLNTEVIGVSRDSIKKHENFKAKFSFPFELLSDPDETLCKAFDVMKEKSMYGKKYMGIERSTFIFDATGKIQHVWRKVSVPGHVKEVLAEIKAINS